MSLLSASFTLRLLRFEVVSSGRLVVFTLMDLPWVFFPFSGAQMTTFVDPHFFSWYIGAAMSIILTLELFYQLAVCMLVSF